MDQGSCSLLLGFDGLLVYEVISDDAGRRVVYCSTDPEFGRVVPGLRGAVDLTEGLGGDPPA